MKSILFLSSLALLLSCNKDSDEYCFAFDERQCNTDVWKEGSSAQSNQELVEKLTDYLVDLGVKVEDVQFDPVFYDAVCQACDVCPTGLRFFVKLGSDPGNKLAPLNLLNFEVQDCNGVF